MAVSTLAGCVGFPSLACTVRVLDGEEHGKSRWERHRVSYYVETVNDDTAVSMEVLFGFV